MAKVKEKKFSHKYEIWHILEDKCKCCFDDEKLLPTAKERKYMREHGYAFYENGKIYKN